MLFSLVLTSLNGISYNWTIAQVGATIWKDRDYTINTIPDELVGTILFQVPHKAIGNGTIISIITHQPCDLYIVHVDEADGRDGGFETNLPNNGWTPITLVEDIEWSLDNGDLKSMSKVVMKTVTDTGIQKSTLPATTTNELVHSIFVRHHGKLCFVLG